MADDPSTTERLADFSEHDAPVRRVQGRKSAAFMQFFKYFLILVCAALAVVTFTWSSFTKEDIVQIPAKDIVRAIQKNEFVEPRFDSEDDKGQPYTITAQRAVRGEGDVVILDDPTGDITLNSGRWVSTRAVKGMYNQEQKRLVLRDDVQIYDSEGYTLEGQHMAIHLDEKIVLSESDVYGQGPAGTIQSKGLYLNIDNGVLSFTGPARLVLFSRDAAKGLGGLR